MFNEFCSKTNSFHQIDKVLKNKFINTAFIDLIRQNIPDEHSYGLRIKAIIESDLSQSADLIIQYRDGNEINEIKNKLINAASIYALRLEEIQREIIKNRKFE